MAGARANVLVSGSEVGMRNVKWYSTLIITTLYIKKCFRNGFKDMHGVYPYGGALFQ